MAFTNELRAEYGGQGSDFWLAYRDGTHKERRLELEAEGSPEDAQRIAGLLNKVNDLADKSHSQNSDQRLVIFAASHHEVIGAYAKWILHTEEVSMKAVADHGLGIILG